MQEKGLELNIFVNSLIGNVEAETTLYLKSVITNCVSGVVNVRMGADTLAATSVVNYSKSYIFDKEMNNMYWIIPSDTAGVAYAVSFTNTGDNVVTVTTNYVIYDESESIDDLVNPIDSVMKSGI